MKKHILNGKMLLLLCILLVSCAKEMSFDALQTSREREKVFFVDFDDATKSFRDENGHNGFCTGDTIRYFGNASKEVRTSLIQDDGTIRCLLAEEDTVITAVYGGIGVEIKGTNSFIIKETDKPIAIQDGNFSTAQKCVARVNIAEQTLIFKNVNSIIKFSLRNKDIAQAYFYANDGIEIASSGLSASTYSNQTTTYPSGDACVSFIPITLDGSGEYYISLSSYTMLACGFTIEFCDKDGNYIGSVKSNNFFNTNQNEIVNLGFLDDRIRYENTIYVVSPNNMFWGNTDGGYVFGNRGKNGAGISASVNDNSKSDTNPSVGPYVTNIQLQNNGNPSNIIRVFTDKNGNIKGFATDKDVYNVTPNDNGGYVVDRGKQNSDGFYEYEPVGQVPKYSNDNINFDGGAYFPSEVLTMYKIASNAVGFTLALAQSSLQGVATSLALLAGEEVASYWLGSGVTQLLAVGGILSSSVTLGWSIGQLSALAIGAAIPGGVFVVAALSAVALAYSTSTLINSLLVDIQDKEVQRLYGDLIPVPLNMETRSETSVVLSCAVNGYFENEYMHEIKIGIILADGSIINHNNYLQKKSTVIQENQTVYSFEFSGLTPLKKYRYRAYLTTDHADDHWQDFCKYSKEIKEFTLIHAVKMSDGTEWATCNAGAQYPWGQGTHYTSRAKLLEDYAGWRIPTEREWSNLFSHKRTLLEINGTPGWEITDESNNTLFIPIHSTHSDNYSCRYITSTKHRNYGYWRDIVISQNPQLPMCCNYDGGYQDQIGYASRIRLVRDTPELDW